MADEYYALYSKSTNEPVGVCTDPVEIYTADRRDRYFYPITQDQFDHYGDDEDTVLPVPAKILSIEEIVAQRIEKLFKTLLPAKAMAETELLLKSLLGIKD